MKSLTGLAFDATPEGVAQEIRQALVCGCGQPLSRWQLQRVMNALRVASRGKYEPSGEAIDVLTGHGLPVQDPKDRPANGRHPLPKRLPDS